MAYKPGYYKRTKGLYVPDAQEPFKLSRSKIDLFVECPRCLYLDRRMGIPRPSMPAFTLNSAVDQLLKNEFDGYREKGEAHPLMEEHGVDAVPFAHKDLETWRHNFTGVQHLHEPTNFLVFGAVDDIWVTPKSELIVVDYKSTSKNDPPTLDTRWGDGYKRQMEVYQWLLRGNGFDVSPIGYFVYVNGRKNESSFGEKLTFDTYLMEYTGDDAWIEKTLHDIKETLDADMIPEAGELCEHCPYRDFAGKGIREIYAQKKLL